MTAANIKTKRKQKKLASVSFHEQNKDAYVSFTLKPEVAEPIYVTHV